MSINNMKAGYQGKKDSMREFADRLTKHAGHAPDTIYSKSCADKERMRIYKEGGMVKKDDEEYERKKHIHSNNHIEKMKKDISKEEERERREQQEKMKEKEKNKLKADEYKKGGSVKKCDKPKFAEGGVAKYRHGQMTLDGKQKGTKKDPYTNHY